MKKMLSLFLAAVLILVPFSTARAIDVSGILEAAAAFSRDDMKLSKTLVIDDWGEITPRKFEYLDRIQLHSGENWTNRYSSGTEAEYAVLFVDIINTARTPHDFLAVKPDYSEPMVKVIYDGTYVYEGWAYQINMDWDNEGMNGIISDLNYAVDPMYAGHYMFGCTLPNAVVDSKGSLQMIFVIDGIEFTFNIRK